MADVTVVNISIPKRDALVPHSRFLIWIFFFIVGDFALTFVLSHPVPFLLLEQKTE